jgi:hypothetical protein
METKRQVTIAGIAIDAQCVPTVLVREETIDTETYRAEYGSRVVEEAIAPYPKHWLRGFYARLAEVLEKHRDYILGAEGVAAMAETEEDRRLVRAIAAGAVMDPQSGVIPEFDD